LTFEGAETKKCEGPDAGGHKFGKQPKRLIDNGWLETSFRFRFQH